MKMSTGVSTAAALLAAMAFSPLAHADQFSFGFNGAGFSGSGVFSAVPNISPPDPDPNCGTPGNNACRSDPPGALMITAISGTFSNVANGISNAAITGLVPIHPANERDPVFDPLVPTSLSFVDYGTPPTGGALTYNNLLFLDGSPIDCDYPFSGTYLDVFGVAFTVAGGYTADLWGDGDMPGLGKTYGIRLIDGSRELANAANGLSMSVAPVPEPSTYALFAAGLLGLIAWRKRGYGADARSSAGIAKV